MHTLKNCRACVGALILVATTGLVACGEDSTTTDTSGPVLDAVDTMTEDTDASEGSDTDEEGYGARVPDRLRKRRHMEDKIKANWPKAKLQGSHAQPPRNTKVHEELWGRLLL